MTQSLAAELAAGRIARDWRFHMDGDSQVFILDELLARETRVRSGAPASPQSPRELLAQCGPLADPVSALSKFLLWSTIAIFACYTLVFLGALFFCGARHI